MLPGPPDDAALSALAGEAGAALRQRGWRVATAESCTGGWIAKCCTDVAGSSAWFHGGLVTYANQAKLDLLEVPASLLASEGAVSRAVAEAMASGARRLCGVDVAVAATGVAGPGGGSPDKPVGTVWLAWAGPDALHSRRLQLAGDRDAVRRQTVAAALQGLLQVLPDA